MTNIRQSESTNADEPTGNQAVVDRDPVAADESTPVTGKHPVDRQEFGGPKGLEPTRYGDWERKGRCIDF